MERRRLHRLWLALFIAIHDDFAGLLKQRHVLAPPHPRSCVPRQEISISRTDQIHISEHLHDAAEFLFRILRHPRGTRWPADWLGLVTRSTIGAVSPASDLDCCRCWRRPRPHYVPFGFTA